MTLRLPVWSAAVAFVVAACSKPAPSTSPPPPAEPTQTASAPEPTASETPPPPDAGAPEAAAAPGPTTEEKTLFIHQAYAACQGDGPMKCLKVRENENDEWTLFYSSIEGFQYKPGMTYELLLEVSTDPNPPMGGSSKRYKLIKIVKQTKAK
ncbi:MAG: DUF4377 domain-containing protein [Polyangiaceae bacterium]